MSETAIVIAPDRGEWPVAIRDLQQGAVAAYPRDVDELHSRLIRWFEEAEGASTNARERSMRDRAYVDGDQWTDAERKALKERGQPEVTINYVRRKLSLLCGLERKARTDPKAFPRTPAEEERADAATQALRYIADDNDFQILRSAVFEEMLVEGCSGIEVSLEDDGQGGAEIRLAHVPWDRLWFDPHSRDPAFGDARYLGVVIWADRDQLLEMYPDAEDVIDTSFADSGLGMAEYNDRPDHLLWTDNQRQRCRVVQCHWADRGQWWTATYTRAGYLVQPMQSMFRDRRGRSACSLILQSGYVDLENNRYGVVRDLISIQDEINKRRSKALHLLSVHQVIAEQGAVPDVDRARREVAKPDGYVEIMPGMKFEIAQGADMAVGQFKLLEHATSEMQLSGPNAAMSGTDPREQSGRAILAQQAGGATQNEPLADALRMWARRVYEMCWQAAREFWTAGKWVRVTDELQETRWVGINRPVTVQDELAAMDEQQRVVVMQQMQLVPGDPRLGQVVRIENDITDLDVDISVAEGQDIPALEAETFQTLVQLAGMQPGLIPPELLIAASSLRHKDDLLRMLKERSEQQGRMQQVASQKAMEKADAETVGKHAKAQADFALAQERRSNTVSAVHRVAADWSSPPFGQPHVAPDTAPMAGIPEAPDPTVMTREMAAAHHMADLAKKQADIQRQAVDTRKVAADAQLSSAKTAETMVNTNRLMRTPITAPGSSKA